MKDRGKNIWIDEVMGSLEGFQRAEAGDAIYRKIETGISLPFSKGRVIPLRRVSLAAACVLLLLVMNVVLLSMKARTNDDHPGNMQTVMEYYGLTNDDGGINL